ncbi:MAG TPA: GNAT family N-acetyltransferase [Casimicrobiaceae bacterium]
MSDDLIRVASTPAEIRQARALFEEYAATLGVSLCFQAFDEELAALPGAYAPPHGGLWLAGPLDAPCGCVAVRPLPHADRHGIDVAELKRLYVQRHARSGGLGRRLTETAIAHARSAGYRAIKLDTLAQMDAARRLYAELGFRPCAAYYDNPLDGTLYMELTL